MTRAVDQKTYWGLGEIVMWIRTGDHERVAALSDLSEEDAMALAMFTDIARLSETEAMVLAVFLDKARLEPRPLLGLTATNSDADREPAAPACAQRFGRLRAGRRVVPTSPKIFS